MSRRAALLMSALFGLSTACIGTSQPDFPPQVNIFHPADRDTVSGVVSIDVDAADDVAVDVVRIFVDGRQLGIDLYVGPYHASWNTIGLPDSSAHTIRAEARDQAGNTATQQIVVTVINGTQ
ncbi:MAG TPA: Ig-like domain-containing protein [Gemmatimonadales bacterium]|jgi:hypothetical protein|nr:Ig-like domain-containing protein [Gemmatimonadales bacterium]